LGYYTFLLYLTESKEVVLSWPYKDCVLEGGQTKEDQKRKEIFWNETLAPDEIDRLLAPKALGDFKKYDKDGEHKVEKYRESTTSLLSVKYSLFAVKPILFLNAV
jgi:adenine-specific DNA-methyltransferase